MVNWVEAQEPILHWLVKRAGLQKQTVELDPNTSITIWCPKEKKEDRPSVVMIHGFAAEGIVTWQFQFGGIAKDYNLYIPDLLFFGGSKTTSKDRSPEFQAECLAKVLESVGVKRCSLVGFSYGGMVSFKLAEARPDLVEAMVISGSVIAMTDSISTETLDRLGFTSSSDLLLPESIKGLKALLSIATHRNLWFPNFLYKDYLEVMFANRKERSELLEGLLISNEKDGKSKTVPSFPQKIQLLWGHEDRIFDIELAKKMKEQLGEKVSFHSIEKGGHLVHLERPCVYTQCIKDFLEQVYKN
ncbi:Hydrolase, alpha/beta fold family protein [Zostera marina]|uniref:Hydrolase, alpha/beta fold family protein n=1 Tax=Zostera marina TaxID=29655 RepID=A0A0K9NXB1_ZOSMR|nr:Hydrolase, alpha/beta fold family protein [Zostera marina]